MKIELLDLTVRDLVAGYQDNGDDGLRGCGGVHRSLATKADLEKLKSDLTFRVIIISAALLGLIKIIPPFPV